MLKDIHTETCTYTVQMVGTTRTPLFRMDNIRSNALFPGPHREAGVRMYPFWILLELG